jgi:nucleotide-binding universal stress UspA family protein
MFRKVLFATDFSEAAERAFAYLEHIVRECGTDVTLLHVHDQDQYGGLSVRDLRERKELECRRLFGLAERLEKIGGRVKVDWLTGQPAEEIVARTRDGRFSLVVMGQHGKGFIREALFGSVANEVARRAEAPVLLIPEVH